MITKITQNSSSVDNHFIRCGIFRTKSMSDNNQWEVGQKSFANNPKFEINFLCKLAKTRGGGQISEETNEYTQETHHS